MKFRELSEKAVLGAGTAIAVFAYSVLTVLLVPHLLNITGADTGLGKILGILGSTVGLLLLIQVTTGLLLRWWAKPVLGLWAYRSSSGNFALLYLDVEGSSLHYRVDVYPTFQDVTGALDNDPRSIQACVAHAYSTALSYRDGVINLIYRIQHTSEGYAPREGVLKLELMPGARGMKGYWHSDVEGEPQRGTLDIYREEAFRRVYATGEEPSGPSSKGESEEESQKGDQANG